MPSSRRVVSATATAVLLQRKAERTVDNVNKTLYIPLYGKAYVSRKGILLSDPKAEEIWEKEGFALKGKSKSKWLAYYMGMRSAVFDQWLEQQLSQTEDAIVLHIGCGMDSRALRVGAEGVRWYDVDFPEVIAERKRYYTEEGGYHMLEGDARCPEAWLPSLPQGGHALVVLEGVSMYLTPEENRVLLQQLCRHFGSVRVLMDCYTVSAAKASRYKNPINDVGVTQVYGIDDPAQLEAPDGAAFVREHSMTPPELTGQLHGAEGWIFRKLFAGSIAARLYRMYEYAGR